MTFRKIIVLILFSISIACNDNRQLTIKHISKTQGRLFELQELYERDYDNAPSKELKETVQNKYGIILRAYLVDTLHRLLDSINVTVDSVIVDGLKVTNQFHTKNIEFKCSMTFLDSMSPSEDSVNNLMRNFKPGAEVMLNFDNLGGDEVNAPGDKNVRSVRIFAVPSLRRDKIRQNYLESHKKS